MLWVVIARKSLLRRDAVKTSLDAAGLQCSEVEADTSKQVFTGLQLNHETRAAVTGGDSNVAVATRSGVCDAPKISDRRSSRQVDRTHYMELLVASS